MREIGSEFWDVPIGDNNGIFPESTQWFISGRSALYSIINELENVKSISLPSWCCDSMIKPFTDAGILVHFYPVYWNDKLIQEIDLNSDAVLLIDYFGYSNKEPILSGYKGVVLRDVTHSVFSKNYTDSAYYFGSLRKWCGLWTGGYAWTNDGHLLYETLGENIQYITLREKAMEQKAEYIDGYTDNKEYLTVYKEAENILENTGISPAADRDIVLAKKIDTEFIKVRRRVNAELLRSAFPDWLIFKDIETTDCPLFVPILVPDGKRDKLRSYLNEKDIYCPVHWPVSIFHDLNEFTKFIYENELSLVCDQRYSVGDMFRMVETINAFWKVA